ncbi:MAG: glycosyltransferase family 9 protein [Chitinispirillaceae bacterium]|nr:glycosyltransferase family 9 protein [Chitinispirillaceae bacterium]
MAVLLYQAGAIGDCITTLPALKCFNERFGGEPLVLLGNPAVGALAREAGLISAYFDSSDRRFLPLFHDTYSYDAAAILSVYSGAILFCDNDSPLLCNVQCSGIKRIYTQPPFPGTAMHVIDYHCSLFITAPLLSDAAKIPPIRVSQRTMAESRVLVPDADPFITIHPGSGSAKKNWPFERFVAVAGHLRSKGYGTVWLRGPSEQTMAFPANDLVLEGVPLPHLAAVLMRSRLYIGNDSGITHLAAVVNCPTVAIFGPSDSNVWGPRGGMVTIVHKRAACSPCHRAGTARATCGQECLRRIMVDDVLKVISIRNTSTFAE